jgi:hypothetical protein
MRKILVGVLALAALALPTPTSAQVQWTGKGFINVGAGIQGGSKEVTTRTGLRLYDEDFTLDTSQHAEGGTVIDVSAGYRVWRNLAIGLGYTIAGKGTDITATADVPDPLFFDRRRAVSATFTEGTHSEQAFHLIGVWMMPITDKIDVAISGGPSYFIVKQSIASDVTVEEPAPTLSSITFSEPDASGIGVNLGVDVTYMVTKRFGAGGTFRYTYADVEIPGAVEKFKAGGPQGTFGVRIRF